MNGQPSLARRRLLLLAPLGVAAAGGAAFLTMLNRMQVGRFDPHDIGNPMLGKPMPDFTTTPVAGGTGFTSADLRKAASTQPVLLNFFASWCIPCAAEAEALAILAQKKIQLWGVAYKDHPAKTADFLSKYGNPYTKLGADTTGRMFIDFGLYGVPESYMIGHQNLLSWHIAGPISDSIIDQQIMPALAKAQV